MDFIRRNLHVVTNIGRRRRRISLTALEFIIKTACSDLKYHQRHHVVVVAVVAVDVVVVFAGPNSELDCTAVYVSM